MPAYEVTNQNDGTPAAMSATPLTQLALYTLTATLRRLNIYEFILGIADAPAANTILWECLRFTAPGTLTATTPNALDPADASAVAPGTAGVWCTAEPTYTAKSTLDYRPVNQQVTQTWVSAGSQGNLVIPAVNNNGIGWRSSSAVYVGTGARVSAKYWT